MAPGSAAITPDVEALIKADAAKNGIASPVVNFSSTVPNATFGLAPKGDVPNAPKGATAPAGPAGALQSAAEAEAAKAAATQGVTLANQPAVNALELSKQSATKAIEAGQAYQTNLHDKVEEEYQLVNRNKQIKPLLEKFNTGGLAPEAMLHLGNMVATSSLLPRDVAKSLGDLIAGGDTSAGKVLENQLASAGILTMLQTLDKEGKPNRAIFQAVQQAQEGLKSGNTTLKDVFELQDRLYKPHYDEQQAMTNAIKSKNYDPSTWAGDYSKIRNDSLSAPAEPLPSASKGGWSATLKAK
jgi:hypothetical protein